MVAKSIAESFEEMPLLAAAAPVKGAFPLIFFTFKGKGENDAVFRGAVVVDADNVLLMTRGGNSMGTFKGGETMRGCAKKENRM